MSRNVLAIAGLISSCILLNSLAASASDVKRDFQGISVGMSKADVSDHYPGTCYNQRGFISCESKDQPQVAAFFDDKGTVNTVIATFCSGDEKNNVLGSIAKSYGMFRDNTSVDETGDIESLTSDVTKVKVHYAAGCKDSSALTTYVLTIIGLDVKKREQDDFNRAREITREANPTPKF